MEKHIKNLLYFLFFLGLFSSPLCSIAQAAKIPTLENIKFNSLSTHEEEVIFKLNGIYIPKVFAIKGKKPRVVFDFPNTITARTLHNIITTNGNFIKKIRIGMHKGKIPKTRVVLDLFPNKNIDFNQNFDQQKNALTVTVYSAGTPPHPHVARQTKPQIAPKYVTQETTPTKSVAQVIPESIAEPATPIFSSFTPTVDSRAPQQVIAPKKSTPTARYSNPEPQKAVVQLRASTSAPPVLHSVRFDNSSNRGEMIQFKLNGFHPPNVFGIEEGLPRVVCDFKNTKIDNTVPKTIKTNGQYVKNIRIGQHKNPKKIRVVIDLEPNNNYDLQQVFFKDDNLFVIIVNIMHNTPPVTELEKPLQP